MVVGLPGGGVDLANGWLAVVDGQRCLSNGFLFVWNPARVSDFLCFPQYGE